MILGLDPSTVFRATDILKGDNEMTIAELEVRTAELRAQRLSVHGPIMALHRKFALPFACFVLSVIGLGLGVQHGRGGKMAAFVPGIAVVFVTTSSTTAGVRRPRGRCLPPSLAVWCPTSCGAWLASRCHLARAVGGQTDSLHAAGPVRSLQAAWGPAGGGPATPNRRTVVVIRCPSGTCRSCGCSTPT